MAKIKLSSIGITNLSGKAGGTIYSRNRGGNYAKNFAVPTNPDTSLQQHVRGIFGSISSSWRSLTQAERDSWAQKSQYYPQKDVFGDTFYLSGFGLYQKLNGNLKMNNLTGLSTAEMPQGVPGISDVNLVADIGTGGPKFNFTVTYGVTSQPLSDFALISQATYQKNAGQTFSKTDYRMFTTLTNVSASPMAVARGGPYQDMFEDMIEGKAVSVRVAMLNVKTGERGAWFSADTVVISST